MTLETDDDGKTVKAEAPDIRRPSAKLEIAHFMISIVWTKRRWMLWKEGELFLAIE
jgi:hypothetical protein